MKTNVRASSRGTLLTTCPFTNSAFGSPTRPAFELRLEKTQNLVSINVPDVIESLRASCTGSGMSMTKVAMSMLVMCTGCYMLKSRPKATRGLGGAGYIFSVYAIFADRQIPWSQGVAGSPSLSLELYVMSKLLLFAGSSSHNKYWCQSPRDKRRNSARTTIVAFSYILLLELLVTVGAGHDVADPENPTTNTPHDGKRSGTRAAVETGPDTASQLFDITNPACQLYNVL